jgi:hypothetical protein
VSGNLTSSHLETKQEELEKKIMNFALQNISFIHRRVLKVPKDLAPWGRRLYFHSKGRCSAKLIALKKSTSLGLD